MGIDQLKLKTTEDEVLSYVDSCDHDGNLTTLAKCEYRTILISPVVECRADTEELSNKLVERIERSWAGWSDFTVGTILSQNHRAGGPGGSGYPSFGDVNRHFLGRAATTNVMMTPATRAIGSDSAFKASNMCDDACCESFNKD